MKGNIYMNKNILELNNNQFIISDEHGNIRIVSTKNIEDKSLIEEVFIKENDIEQLEEELEKNEKILKTTKENTIWGEITNIIMYIGLITIHILCPISTTGKLIIIGYTYLIIKGLNCTNNGTRLGRFIKKRKTRKNINTIESYLINLRNELEQLKSELKYTELTKLTSEEEKKYNYSYIFQDIKKESHDLTPIKEIHGLKLTRKKTNELLESKK